MTTRRPRILQTLGIAAAMFTVVACAGDGAAAATNVPVVTTPVVSTDPIAVVSANPTQAAMVGVPFRYDASRGNTVFSDPRRTGLAYQVTGTISGLTATGCEITGTPVEPGVQTITVTARDTTGRSATQTFTIVVFGADLTTPALPATSFDYSDASAPLPRHFTGGGTAQADNMPIANPTTDAGATLGRVLFYDRRLSRNDRVACASCHLQVAGFADTVALSRGFAGGLTGRTSMALGNARWYQPGRFFWDERAASLEAQVLQPIQDATEMGLTLEQLVLKVQATTYYAPLFTAAFGSAEITTDRISRALAQFVRSLVSGGTRYDRAFELGGPGTPNFAATLTAQEVEGLELFTGRAGCARCHGTSAHVSDAVHNTGLDATITDVGAGGGRFKAPSLRNVGVRPRLMHDGRFTSIEQAIDFYNTGVQSNPALDPRLRAPGGQPQRLNLTPAERAALAAFLRALTDDVFLTNPKFGSPFPR